jgi:hypothetical protein
MLGSCNEPKDVDCDVHESFERTMGRQPNGSQAADLSSGTGY